MLKRLGLSHKSKSAASSDNLTPLEPIGPIRQLLSPTWLSLFLMSSGVFLVVMLALAIWNDRGVLAMWRVQHEVAQLASEVQLLEQNNQSLWRDIERLRGDMGYIEKIAREELGLVRPGELVFEFVE